MASLHNTAINEYNKPPGNIVNDIYWVFPTVNKQKGKKTTVWNITVELYENDKNIKLSHEYFSGTSLQDAKYKGSYYTTTGESDGKKVESEKTYILQGKNLGSKNRTNVFTQSLMDARARYNRNKNVDITSTKIGTAVYSPMLLHIYNKKRVNFDNERYYMQCKMDGLRSVYHNNTMMSRQKKAFPTKIYLNVELNKLLDREYCTEQGRIDSDKLYLDGELYIHGIPLEDLNSIARNSAVNDLRIEYHVFDVFYPDQELPYNLRLKLLNDIFNGSNCRYVKKVETTEIHSIDEIDDIHNVYVKSHKYEGAVLRNGSGVYDLNGGRTYNVLKIKKRVTEGMVVIDYKEGVKGRDKGGIIFIVDPKLTGYTGKIASDELKTILSGVSFNVVSNWTLEKRKDEYTKCKNIPNYFNDTYYGSSIKIEFDTYSKKGIPLRAKGADT